MYFGLAIALLILSVLCWIFLLVLSRAFAVKLIFLFFGVYYILPPFAFVLFSSGPGHVNMSGEAIFLTEDVYGVPFSLMNFLTLIFLLILSPLRNLKPAINNAVYQDLYRNRRSIYYSLFAVFSFVVLLNVYIVAQAGGLYEFYFGGDWHSRYENSGSLMVVVMNLRSILPCVGVALAALILKYPKNHMVSGLLLLSFIILLVFGGSNRKFALLAIFIYFIVCVDILSLKKAKSIFWGTALAMFFLFQALLFLRTSSFDLYALGGAFSQMGEVILTSEPVGTYSNNLSLLYVFLGSDFEYGYFYDAFKFVLIPFRPFIDYGQPNVAWVLGSYINDVPGFTFFPTIIIEGFYNLGFLGFLLLTGAYYLVILYVLKCAYSARNIFQMVFWVVVFSVCLMQMIRGYLSVCLAYFIILVLVFIIFKVGGVCARSVLSK